jgi:hypothetical protein
MAVKNEAFIDSLTVVEHSTFISGHTEGRITFSVAAQLYHWSDRKSSAAAPAPVAPARASSGLLAPVPFSIAPVRGGSSRPKCRGKLQLHAGRAGVSVRAELVFQTGVNGDVRRAAVVHAPDDVVAPRADWFSWHAACAGRAGPRRQGGAHQAGRNAVLCSDVFSAAVFRDTRLPGLRRKPTLCGRSIRGSRSLRIAPQSVQSVQSRNVECPARRRTWREAREARCVAECLVQRRWGATQLRDPRASALAGAGPARRNPSHGQSTPQHDRAGGAGGGRPRRAKAGGMWQEGETSAQGNISILVSKDRRVRPKCRS